MQLGLDTHIIEEHVDSVGAGLLQCLIQRLNRLVVIGCIKAKLFQVLHLGVTASKPLERMRRKSDGTSNENNA